MANDARLKRAVTSVQIAQLKFKQGLKKADGDHDLLPVVQQEQSVQFCKDLDAVLERCSPQNVQTCNDWIMKHIARSKVRISLLGEYLVALSKFALVDPETLSDKVLRTRLDILLIISDVLHTDKFHGGPGIIAKQLHQHIEELADLAGSCLVDDGTKHEKELVALLKFWRLNNFLEETDMESLRLRLAKARKLARGDTLPEPEKKAYTLPDWFGDRGAPWHELPASYMLQPLISYPNRSIEPSKLGIRRFQNPNPPESVCELLDDYFEKLDVAYQPTKDKPAGDTDQHELWVDSMGQIVKQDKEGATVALCNGYGWSMQICGDMEENGVPDEIDRAREEHRVNRMDIDVRSGDSDTRRHSNFDEPSPPRRRRHSSSSSDYHWRRNRSSNERSDINRLPARGTSRPGSRSSHSSGDQRPASRDGNRIHERGRQSRFSNEGSSDYEDVRRNSLEENPGFDQRRGGPPRPAHSSNWHNNQPNQNMYNEPPNWNNHRGPPDMANFPGQNVSYSQPYASSHSTTLNASGYPPPPPPDQSGQFPISPYQVPFGGLSAPLPGMSGPTNFHGAFGNGYASSVGGQENNGYGNYGPLPGQNAGFGGYGHSGFQGGNYNGRGGYRGNNQRGRGGSSRWS